VLEDPAAVLGQISISLFNILIQSAHMLFHPHLLI